MDYNAGQLTFLTIDSIVVTLIVIGNISVMTILAVKANLKQPKNACLFSLALADLFVGAFVIPNVMILRFTEVEWKSPVCKMCLYLEYSSAVVSAFTISVMSIDRFKALVFPLKFRDSKMQFVCITLTTVWVLAFLYGLRAPLVYDTAAVSSSVNNVTKIVYVCGVPKDSVHHHNMITILDFLLTFAIPGMILVVCNSLVTFKLGHPVLRNENEKSNFRKRRRAIRLLLIMVAIFIVCHLPLYAFRLHVIRMAGKVQDKSLLIQIFQLLSWSNSFINILFYGSLNDELKAMAYKIIDCCCRSKCFKNRVGPDVSFQKNYTLSATANVASTSEKARQNPTIETVTNQT